MSDKIWTMLAHYVVAAVPFQMAAAVAAAAFPSPAYSAHPVASIFRFASPLRTGDFPVGTPLVDASGALYITTKGGTSNLPKDLGTVVKLIPPTAGSTTWTSTLLHLFTGGNDGDHPNGGLAIDVNGNLFGTTPGQVFKLSPPSNGQAVWTKTAIFSGYGQAPLAPVIIGKNGVLYGTIAIDGTAQTSSVFSLTPPAKGATTWTYSTLYTFVRGGSDGDYPVAGLIQDSSGSLYGTTEGGGAANLGTVFKLTPPATGSGAWSETQLYAFQGGADGASPMAPVAFGSDGSLYGTTFGGTVNGGGSIFKLTPPATGGVPWTETQICVLSLKLGVNPEDGVYVADDGSLYTTLYGGGKHSAGSVVRFVPPQTGETSWSADTIYDFYSDNKYWPSMPVGGLALGLGGLLYGSTSLGGPNNGGTAFSFEP
jgi:uncharacterized repeat protein (TIGR03803 family)